MSKKIIIIVIIIAIMLVFAFSVWHLSRDGQKKGEQNIFTDKSFEEIKDRGKIVVGTSVLFEPMSFTDKEGRPIGFDLDLAMEIANRLGVELEIKTMAFADLFSAVEQGEIDIAIDSITITQERSKVVLFSTIYLTTGQRIVVHKDNMDIKSTEDLVGKKVGVQKGTTGEEEAIKYAGKENVMAYDDRKEIGALKAGYIDATITDDINAATIVKTENDLKIVGEVFSEEYYGTMTKIGNKELISEVNKILNDMRISGLMKQLGDKWNINWQ